MEDDAEERWSDICVGFDEMVEEYAKKYHVSKRDLIQAELDQIEGEEAEAKVMITKN